MITHYHSYGQMAKEVGDIWQSSSRLFPCKNINTNKNSIVWVKLVKSMHCPSYPMLVAFFAEGSKKEVLGRAWSLVMNSYIELRSIAGFVTLSLVPIYMWLSWPRLNITLWECLRTVWEHNTITGQLLLEPRLPDLEFSTWTIFGAYMAV